MRYVGGQKDNDLVTLVSESLSTGSRFAGPPIEQGEIVVGRHSVAQGEAFEFNIDLSKAPAPGSRRAARLAARAQQGLSQSLLHPDSPLGYLVRPFTENEEEAHAAAAAEAPVPEAPVEAAPVDALVDEELASVGATSTKKSRFSLFSRSRAAVVAGGGAAPAGAWVPSCLRTCTRTPGNTRPTDPMIRPNCDRLKQTTGDVSLSPYPS